MSIYDYSVTNTAGEEVSLKNYEGKVLLIVNTATGCGFTPQYEDIEKMYEEYHEKGLEIIDIPCNQFMGQTPGTDEEIHEFCTLHYNTQFPQMTKSEVNGENALPVYAYLKEQKGFTATNDKNNGWAKDDIKWNFTKFVVDREGNVVARFEPTQDMAELRACVETLL